MRSLITIALATLLLAPLARANEGGEDGRTGSDVEPAVEVVQPEVEAAAVPPTAGLVASPMAEYQARRLQLADRGGQWIGPSELGYPGVAFGRDVRRSYRVVRPGRPGRYLRIPAFARLADLPALHARLEQRRLQNTERMTAGLIALGFGEAFGTSALILGAVANGTDFNAMYGVPFMAAGSILSFVIAIVLTRSSLKWRERLRGARMERVWSRAEAWRGVEAHNSRLRRELGLPDDAALDGPPD
jgi:hypothetical protein